MKDYWGPVCRFSLRFGAKNLDDAEDVASQTFEVIWENRLLVRWAEHRTAKLRTLLCTVVRNILANRHRVQANRKRLAREMAQSIERPDRIEPEQDEAFYAAWVEDLVGRAVEALATEYYAVGKGDYVRVLYGRLCRGLSMAEVAQSLGIKPTDVDNFFRHAKKRLGEKFEDALRRHVTRYCPGEETDEEFAVEWRRLGQYLADHGGLEDAVRRTFDLLDPMVVEPDRRPALTRAITRVTSIVAPKGDS